EPRQWRNHVAHGEPAVGKDVAKGVLSPARGGIRRSSGKKHGTRAYDPMSPLAGLNTPFATSFPTAGSPWAT
ncbi:MAG: hypothetical protein ACLQVM_26740, partial [Terriglobia bacterium]